MSHSQSITPNEKDQLQVLEFVVQNTHICINITYINQVLPLMHLEPVPGAAACLAGLMNLAGESIPVIDLAICLGLKRHKKYTLDNPILLCSENNHKLGIIVDSISGLSDIRINPFQMNDAFKKKSLFLGVHETRQGLSLLMNMGCIFKSYVQGDSSALNFDRTLLEGARNENT